VQTTCLEKTDKIKGYSPVNFIQKRFVDFSIGGLLLIISFPIMLYSIYRIKKESKGSILFKQQRVGLNGKKFTCYKFRSMHEKGKPNLYRIEKDDRVFKYGDLMRKTRIDELPQLWNVFKGDMHLIGPRAEWDILVEKYEKEISEYHNRHKVRPGITGLAQVYYPYGRNAQDTKNKLKYDIFYIQNWSLLLEIKIIWKTVLVIFGRMGV
jgi:lipopolysaccharide/colanic/teichoic acid biosynthesis glycosyltransferase